MSCRLTAMNINERTLSPSTYQGDTRTDAKREGIADDMWLIYEDSQGGRHFQHWNDLTESGTLTDGESDEDMDLIGWTPTMGDEDNDDTRPFKAVFMDAEGEENLLLGYFDGPLEAFRFLQQFPMLGRVDWGFDGDCWYTDNTQTFMNAAGQVMVGSYSVHIR